MDITQHGRGQAGAPGRQRCVPGAAGTSAAAGPRPGAPPAPCQASSRLPRKTEGDPDASARPGDFPPSSPPPEVGGRAAVLRGDPFSCLGRPLAWLLPVSLLRARLVPLCTLPPPPDPVPRTPSITREPVRNAGSGPSLPGHQDQEHRPASSRASLLVMQPHTASAEGPLRRSSHSAPAPRQGARGPAMPTTGRSWTPGCLAQGPESLSGACGRPSPLLCSRWGF